MHNSMEGLGKVGRIGAWWETKAGGGVSRDWSLLEYNYVFADFICEREFLIRLPARGVASLVFN